MHESVLVCGSLHWYREELGSESNMILVFDTTGEVFWQMCAPVVSSSTRLFEMDGTLGMSTVNDEAKIVDIWVMKDYESEVWALKCRVELPVAEIRLQFGTYGNFWTAMVDFWNLIVVSVDGELLVLLAYDDWLLLVDMDGKLVDSSRKEMCAPAVPTIAHLFEMDGMPGMSSVNDEVTIVDIWVMKDYESKMWPSAESFRQMCVPAVLDFTQLFEMDGMLGMSSVNDESTIVDIWVMKDYEREVWTFRCRVELPVAEIRVQFGKYECPWDWHVEVMPHGELFLLVENGDWLLQVDMDSKLVDSFQLKRLGLAEFRHKQTLVQHAFFPTLEGYVVNALPFILWLSSEVLLLNSLVVRILMSCNIQVFFMKPLYLVNYGDK
ncbi:uncharacterized protein LOC104583373 [Brachypodium distachyon]|uniref:uncharacterized protein LOC104583373 n=1 Tax=Brachypodium distachyon TaxID=15368 RepID=UPI000D0D0678|nr:uncharacterized protein LOC104583373 [Brachypodium distachyon]|eukprot:XP_024314648.1 uncharacterized protein LOC104583373 [Brachypodium distachyon]